MDNVNFNILLYKPEIPQNTGNIGRLCVGTNCRLNLVKPYGFDINEKQLRRAGLDYWKHLDIKEFDSWKPEANKRTFFFSKKATKSVFDVRFQRGDYLVFGQETKGLPEDMMADYPENCLTLPHYGPIRSHNLANSVAAVTYLALRDLDSRGECIKTEPQ